MTIADDIKNALRDYKTVTATFPLGDPSSPVWNPPKKTLRDALAQVGDLVEFAYQGKQYATRAAFVADSGYAPADGTVVTADGLAYLRKAGATDISDLPGWIPTGIIYAEHFGLNADLTFTTETEGFVRSGGTNDRAAIEAADAYAISSGKGFFFCKSDIYLQGQVNLASTLHWETGFRNYVWCDVGELESGFVIDNPNGGLSGVLGIIQHNTTSKEGDRGHHGNFVTVGRFVSTSAPSRITGVHIDVRVCRAADVIGQDSWPSPTINLIGYAEHCSAKIGMFGNSNVRGSIFYQSHWGGHNATGNPRLEPVETYHPNNIDVEIVGPITHHTRGVVLSSTFNMRISDYTTDGVKYPFLFLPGDNVNAYAIAAHKPHVGLNNRIGKITARNVPIDAGDGDDAVLITSRGTSKFETFSGSAKELIRQIPIGLTFGGFDIALTGDNTTTTGVRCFGVIGSVDLGEIRTSGETKACVEIEVCNADISVDVKQADMDVLYEYSTGGSILGSAVDKSSDYASENYCVQVLGKTATTTTTADVAVGDTTVSINGFTSDDVHVGDRLLIGTIPAIAAGFTDNETGTLIIEPAQGAVTSGATVTLDLKARLRKLVANYQGSEYGARINNADVDFADFSAVKWTGRNAARITGDSIVRASGNVPLTASRIVTTGDYTFRVDPSSKFIGLPSFRIGYSPQIQAHFQVVRVGASGPWGIAILNNSIIDSDCLSPTNRLYSATEPFRQISMEGCVGEDGQPIDHPDGQGSDANGEWVKHRDGSMECWARNVNIGATQPYTWTLPGGGFIDTARGSVQVTPASAVAPRMGHGLINSATTAEVWVHNDDGTDAPSTGVNLYARGYWR